MRISALGYVGFESPEAKQWEEYGPEILAMQLAEPGADGTVYLRMDEKHHRLAIHPGERDRLAYLGWEVRKPTDFDVACEELRAAGVEVEYGSDELLADRCVDQLAVFKDPGGFQHELFVGQLHRFKSFSPARVGHAGFVTGDEGLGHAVLIVPDLDRMYPFVKDLLGFRVALKAKGTFGRLAFMACNPRHHTLGMLELPGKRGLMHVMIQCNELDDVGISYDLVQEREIPITLTLGRHSGDRALSFYMRSPSGFDIEYGWDSHRVEDPEEEVAYGFFDPQGIPHEIWGHKSGGHGPPTNLESVD